jgi:hypothetical protein
MQSEKIGGCVEQAKDLRFREPWEVGAETEKKLSGP